jgi:hypothetical protein
MKTISLILSVLIAQWCTASSEITAFAPGVSSVYAVVRSRTGDVWYVIGQVFESWGTGGRTASDYDIALTDKGGGMFVGDFDTNISAGTYYLATHYQAGGAPADSDPVIWVEKGHWNGSEWFTGALTSDVNDINDVITEILADTNELQTDWTDGGRLDLILDDIYSVTNILELLDTTVSDANDANSFTLTAGSTDPNAYRGMILYVQDSNDGSWDAQMITKWTAGRVVYLDKDLAFTPAVADRAIIWGTWYFPIGVYESLPVVPGPQEIEVNARAASSGGSTGGTKTINWMGEDP